MTFSTSLSRGAALAAQCILPLFGLAGLYAYPPATGRMLLVPLTYKARGALVPIAIAQGARLVARGPLAGSVLVDGDRNRLAPALLRRGVIALSAQMGGCGETA